MTLPALLAHVAARWAATRTPAHGWVPDESEIEMTEHETLTAVKTDNLVQMLLQQLSQHQRTRPFDPDNVDDPPAYEIARMDEWQRMESALLTVLGARLAYLALDQWQEATA